MNTSNKYNVFISYHFLYSQNEINYLLLIKSGSCLRMLLWGFPNIPDFWKIVMKLLDFLEKNP